jgi:hypothetical protein
MEEYDDLKRKMSRIQDELYDLQQEKVKFSSEKANMDK